MDTHPIKNQKRIIVHPFDENEPPNKKIRFEHVVETSQVVFNTELKSRKRRNLDDINAQNCEDLQSLSKVPRINYNSPQKEKSNYAEFESSDYSNTRKRKYVSDEEFVEEKYSKTNNNSDIELSRKMPDPFKIHIQTDDQWSLGNSLSNNTINSHNLNFSPHQYQQKAQQNQMEDMNMEISPDPIHSNSSYSHINSVLSQFHYERLARGKHINAQSPKKKHWTPEIDPNEKGLRLDY